MSTYINSPVVVALANKPVPVPGPNERLCPTCRGLGMSIYHGYVEGCRDCRGGVADVCEHCGEVTTIFLSSHRCPGSDAAERSRLDALDLTKWKNHPAIPPEQASEMLWSQRLDRYLDWDGIEDAWNDSAFDAGLPEGTPMPADWPLLYDTDPVSFSFDADELFEDFDERHGSDEWVPSEEITAAARAELQQLLDAWVERHGLKNIGHMVNYKRPVTIGRVEQ